MIPCIKNKCLKLPICVSKIRIDCIILKDYYDSIQEDMEWEELWIMLNKTFPNLESILPMFGGVGRSDS